MRLRLVLFMLGATLILPASAAAAPKISLHANTPVVATRQAANLSGRLASGKAGRAVVIKASQFPYGKQKTIVRTHTRHHGRFSARVKPFLNTRYQAVLKQAPGAGSNTVRIAVSPLVHNRCNYCVNAPDHAGYYTLRSNLTFTFPNKSSARFEASKPFFFYYSARKGHKAPPRLRLRKRVNTTYVGGRKVQAKVRYRFHRRRSAYVFALQGCIKDTPNKDGIGLSGNHRCGDRSIPRTLQYLGRSTSARAASRSR